MLCISTVFGVEWCPSVRFLADRTNGRAIATLLRLSSSVCRLSSVCLSVCDVMYCG